MSRALRLGIFIVTTLVILGVGVFLIGSKQFLFERTYRLSAQFQDVAGLNNGADVQLGGVHVGTVKYTSLPNGPDKKLTVIMEMSDSTRNIIRRDSVATIKTEGLLGNKYVEVSSGSETAPPVKNGDMIKGVTPEDFSEVAISAANQAKEMASAFQEDADALRHNFLLRGYFERRGYQNMSELNENRISKLPSQRTRKDFAYDAKELFGKSDTAELKDKKMLDEAGQFLEHNKFDMAVVADSLALGDTNKDRLLTQARASVIRDYLVQNFAFDDTRLKIIGLGKSESAGDSGKVEILVYD